MPGRSTGLRFAFRRKTSPTGPPGRTRLAKRCNVAGCSGKQVAATTQPTVVIRLPATSLASPPWRAQGHRFGGQCIVDPREVDGDHKRDDHGRDLSAG